MFVVYVGSILTTLLWVQALVGTGEAPAWFIFWVSVWLWFTVLFANFAEAMAEGRGKAQAASLCEGAPRHPGQAARRARSGRGHSTLVSASTLRKGDLVLVEAGDFIPADGDGDRGHRLGQRGGDHRRERAGDPRERRRPQRGHRRHAGAVGLAHRPRSRRTRARPSSTG